MLTAPTARSQLDGAKNLPRHSPAGHGSLGLMPQAVWSAQVRSIASAGLLQAEFKPIPSGFLRQIERADDGSRANNLHRASSAFGDVRCIHNRPREADKGVPQAPLLFQEIEAHCGNLK